jgi:dTDP-4-amino-4,6-dideoxygalactose transaminase
VRWRRSYDLLAERFAAIPHIEVPQRPPQEDFVPSSIQFSITGLDAGAMESVLKACKARGVDIKWFGRQTPVGFTSTWRHWQFVQEKQSLPETDHMLAALCDMRIPVNLIPEDCQLIADIVNDALTASLSAFQSGPSIRRDPF